MPWSHRASPILPLFNAVGPLPTDKYVNNFMSGHCTVKQILIIFVLSINKTLMHEDEFDLPEELDPVEKAKLQEQYETEIAASMTAALDMIHDMGGLDTWIRTVNFSKEKKVKILTNMMNWFAAPEREMYEEAAEMRDGLQKLNK
jgi:hypothetical protein